MEFAPIQFKPILKERVWGSGLFNSLFKKSGSDEPIGECWLMADTPEDESVINGGIFDGKTFKWFLQEYGEAFGFTSQQCMGLFSLTVKYLDAGDTLSVQVQPDLEVSRKYSQVRPLVECWYIIEAKPDAFIYAGLNDGIVREDMERALTAGTVGELLHKKKVAKGDFFFIQPGMVHALGAGIIAAEISTWPGISFRLYDWDRVDSRGLSRTLHVNEALESIYFADSVIPEDQSPAFVAHGHLEAVAEMLGEGRTLVDCPYFTVAEVKISKGEHLFKTAMPIIFTTVSGVSRLSNKTYPEQFVNLAFGSGAIFPATQHGKIEVEEEAVLLMCIVGTIIE